jgi:hypothetical protein
MEKYRTMGGTVWGKRDTFSPASLSTPVIPTGYPSALGWLPTGSDECRFRTGSQVSVRASFPPIHRTNNRSFS